MEGAARRDGFHAAAACRRAACTGRRDAPRTRLPPDRHVAARWHIGFRRGPDRTDRRVGWWRGSGARRRSARVRRRADQHSDAVAGRVAQHRRRRGARRLRSKAAEIGPLMVSLFPEEPRARTAAPAPLAERMRPRTFEEFVGQEDLLAPGKPLREAIERDLLQSIILWGPP